MVRFFSLERESKIVENLLMDVKNPEISQKQGGEIRVFRREKGSFQQKIVE